MKFGSPEYHAMVKRAMARPREEGEIGQRILLQWLEEITARVARLNGILQKLDPADSPTTAH